ncbi:MAG: anthranilate synthase component I family protein [Flavobacterium sp.]|nr:anthranilate synthase component I family protein [Flavobacterium sp.]
MRTSFYTEISDVSKFKCQLLQWSQSYNEIVYLDSNVENNNQKYLQYDLVVAVEAFTSIKTDYINSFQSLHQYQSQTKDWLFGYLSYDLKNDLEDLKSDNLDGLQFPDLFFFQPKKLFLLKDNLLEIHYLKMCDDELEFDFNQILNFKLQENSSHHNVAIQQRIKRADYLTKTTQMLAHIQRGDIYEANFCMEFFAEKAIINPLQIYQKLNEISTAPNSVYFKNYTNFLLCASPERYLKKIESKIISQPIKGTAMRHENLKLDEKSKFELANNQKERCENIMIVDLVRNDLSRTATKGSVKVEELCKIYSFKQVHQMISTIISEIDTTAIAPIEVLQTTFPMGSMTGAPKIAAMKIIENLEETKRGLYSGAVGYFDPNSNFDFNVVIRSILYNSKNQYLSFSVGSAITAEAIPENEYEECLLKAKAMFAVLS